MSTRVDKGGPKFKPILKSKARPSATPAPQDARTRPSVEPSASMPPPSTIPERTPSVAPVSRAPSVTPAPSSSNAIVPTRSIPHPIAQIQPSRATPIAVQPSKAQRGGMAISLPSPRPAPSSATQIQPSRAIPIAVPPSQGSTNATVDDTTSTETPAPTSTPITAPSRDNSAQPVAGPSRGVPIALSRSTPAPSSTPGPTASSKGKKRAAPDTADTETTTGEREEEHPEPTSGAEGRGGVARKRPKLSIVQAEADRVKRPRRAKAKKKVVASEGEGEGETAGEGTSDAGGANKRKRPSRKKKTVDENATGEETAEGPSRPKRTRAKRKQTHDDEAAEPPETGDSDSDTRAKQKKKRGRTVIAESQEPEGTPEPIDPTQVKMSAICDDPGSGRVSSRWETSQVHYAEARKRAREERMRAIAEADEEERETGRIGAKKGVPKPVLPGEGGGSGAAGEESVMENTGQNPDEFTYTESLKASHYAPQVRIGANGEVVLDTDSLQVDRAADPDMAEEAYSFVEESDQSKFTNSSSWSKRRTVRWGKEDTAMFYDALRQFGQNFDLIARVLPGRTYRMCKNKFKAEDKKNSGLIDDALKNGVAVDLGALSRMTGKDFSGPTPIIEAKRALDLREDDEPAQHTAPGEEGSAPKESQTPGIEGEEIVEENAKGGDETSDAEPDARSPSPPPAESLLSTINTTRQSASPLPAESLLGTFGTAGPSSDASAATQPSPVPISAPNRAAVPVAISAPTRPAFRAPAKVVAATTPAPAVHVNTQPPGPSAKKKGRKKAAQEDGVEVLGLVDEHVGD